MGLPDAPLAFAISTDPLSKNLEKAQFAGLLTATVTSDASSLGIDVPQAAATGLTASLGVALDSSDDATLTLSGTANANIGLSLTFGDPSNNGINPTISTGIQI